MANTKKFVVKNGVVTPNVEIISTDETKVVEINVTNDGKVEFVKDEQSIFSISDNESVVPYNNTLSGLTSTTVQNAIDEIIDSKGAISGIAELDESGRVPSGQLPSYVDDVLEYANLSSFPVQGESSKIYIALDTNLTYRWSGTIYVEISQGVVLGETSTTAYRGDRGKIAYDHSQTAHAPADAEKNVNPDWNATSGDGQILNKPTTLAGYGITDAEPKITTKNTAFNKNYGTTATDVKMNGTQGVGSVDAIARIDHVHPTDTSRVPTSRTVNGKALSSNVTIGGADVTATGYTIATSLLDVSTTDSLNTAIGKVEYRAKNATIGNIDGGTPSSDYGAAIFIDA